MEIPTSTFQPTLPARGATRWRYRRIALRIVISTHAPRTGSDNKFFVFPTSSLLISTHAPRTGSDVLFAGCATSRGYFNPRSPHGERRFNTPEGVAPLLFQPTLPARGATRGRRDLHPRRRFQPTLPARGATVRLHRWRRTHKPISTHAPRTGSDKLSGRTSRQKEFQPTLPARGATYSRSIATTLYQFQPTLPARGATRSERYRERYSSISTHAPRTGSDPEGDPVQA